MSDIQTGDTGTMDTTISTATDAFKATQTSLQDAAGATYAQASAGIEKGQAQLKDTMEKAMKKAEEVASFSQGTFEAAVKSSQIWASGMQDLGKELAASAQTQMDETVSVIKTMTGMRSLKDLMDLQASFARAAVEKAMSQTGRFTDASFKLAEEAMAPLTARVSLAVETFSKTV